MSHSFEHFTLLQSNSCQHATAIRSGISISPKHIIHSAHILAKTLVLTLICAIFCWALSSGTSYAQPDSFNLEGSTGGKTREIERLEADIEIDGILNEAVWDRATLINDFHQYQPVEYAEPSQRTDVRIFYTENSLYIAARLWDDRPDLISANVLRQGQGLNSDDVFAVILDPYLDRRNGYRFEVNSNGVRWEGLFANVTQVESSWDGIWQSAATRDDQGWIAEMRIPFQTIAFSTNSNAWGINFNRSIPRINEDIAWVSRNRQVNPGIAGTITGLNGMRQGLGLDVVPSIAMRGTRQFGTPGSSDQSIEPQLDVFYRLTSELNASLTLNTDFSATEVDNRQVNLTRFSLFFPEKRDFFIRESDIFEFGQVGLGGGTGISGNASMPGAAAQNGRPFFSRRIGLSPTGSPVDLNAGAKLSGRIGDWNVGTLVINQGDDSGSGVESDSIFVGRASLNVLAESQIGIIATEGDPQSNLDSSLVGGDFRYRNSRLPNGKTMEVAGFYQQSDTEGKQDDDASYGMLLNYPSNQGISGRYQYKRVEQNFDPAVGFVNQNGIEDHSLISTYRHFVRPGGFLQSLVGIYNGYRSSALNDGHTISDVHTLRYIVADNYGDTTFGRLIQNKEVLLQDFTINRSSDGSRTVVIPAGTYDFNEKLLGVRFAPQRTISGNFNTRWGEYFNGKHRLYSVSSNWIISPQYQVGLNYNEDRIQLPSGNFTTRLFALTTQVAFSSTLSWINLIQYDNVSEVMGINSRLHWIPEAGRQAFLVLNYGFEDFNKDNVFESTSADLSLKFNYTFRF